MKNSRVFTASHTSASSTPVTRFTSSATVLLGLTLLGSGCSKKEEAPPSAKTEAVSSAAAAPSAAPASAPSAVASSAAAAGPSALGCGADGWEKLEVKALQDGGLSVPKEGAVLPAFSFAECDGKKDCTKLALGEAQELLDVGQNGNDVRFAVTEKCGDDVLVWIADAAGKTLLGFRGHDIAIGQGVLGGDRLLLSGIARHRSEKATGGVTPRAYLFTVRTSAPKKVEVARNKQSAVPVAAASQLVVVDIDGSTCGTMFWKLGVDQCDFGDIPSREFATFGSHIVFKTDDDQGRTYGTKEGERPLLAKLDWIVTDGINVAWSSEGELAMTQPKFDLPELAAEAAPGAPGPRPLAIGCQRLLTEEGGEYHLRNVKLGSEWRFSTDRLPEGAGEPAALGCDKLYTTAGVALGLKAIGQPVPLPAAPSEPAEGDAPVEAAPAEGDTPKADAPSAAAPAEAAPTEAAPAEADAEGD